MPKSKLKEIPAVDLLLNHPQVKELKENYSSEFIKYCIRVTLDQVRLDIKKGVGV